jgi:glycosyltransferase involved in cell wall biosynthesis
VAKEFSIVLPTHNRPTTLGRAVESVLRQEFHDFELLIVDDGSDEPYASAWVSRDPRIHVIRNPRNTGVGHARNLGIGAARGEWISFLDDDDEYVSTFLMSTRARLRDAPDTVAISWCGAQFVDYGGGGATPHRDRVREFNPSWRGKELYEGLLSIGTGFGVTVRAKCLREIGAFDVALRAVEDTDLFLRLLARGFSAVVIPGTHVVIHNHSGRRLTGLEFHSVRIRECELLLRRYTTFLDGYSSLRSQLLRQIEILQGELALVRREEVA